MNGVQNATWSRRYAVWAILIGLFAGVGGGLASATVAYGSWTGFSVNGGSYHNRAYIDNSANQARTVVGTTSGSSVGAGRLGAVARSYKSSTSALCHASSLSYNSYSTSSYSVAASAGGCGSGYFFSSGYSKVYNSSSGGYSTVGTIQSPNLYIN